MIGLDSLKLALYILLINIVSDLQLCIANHIKGLDDSILFRLTWPGQDDTLLNSPDYEKLEMTTVNNEKFQCLIPLNYGETNEEEEKYTGPNPLQLLMPLFKNKVCTLRLESFWTYELCHGQWIKQYHEGREELGQRFQDYSLGRTSLEELIEKSNELDELLSTNPKIEVPQTKLEGVTMPYFAVSYSDGTLCDLTGNPRVTRVLYVCYEEGRHSVYSIKETFTCEYEIIVLSSLLCQHPAYRPQDVPQTNLHCIPMQEGTKRPKDLLHLEAESLKLRTHGTVLGGDISGGSLRISVIDEGSEEAEILRDFSPEEESETRRTPFPPQPSMDRKLVEDFLNGDYCLQGGSGWWKYEFCYGKYVQQYHEEKDGSKYSINLGIFDIDHHKSWIKEHSSKKFRDGKTQVSHFYSNGDYCDPVSKPRQVEVRLKCKEALSPNSVTLYLLEPKTCEYVLGVETPIICPLLQNADEFGLFSLDEPMILNVGIDIIKDKEPVKDGDVTIEDEVVQDTSTTSEDVVVQDTSRTSKDEVVQDISTTSEEVVQDTSITSKDKAKDESTTSDHIEN
ncbi:UNVERIFIED_CONTAM: hypothetical protein RMT77_014051 [Armadillidium vulgare]